MGAKKRKRFTLNTHLETAIEKQAGKRSRRKRLGEKRSVIAKLTFG
jgi:hypothetical protein